MALKARDIMTASPGVIDANSSVAEAAQQLAKLDVGALPICVEGNQLRGMITDRDIVVKVIAEGQDPSQVKAGDLGHGKPVTIGADDSVHEILETMAEHKVRRLPVIDGHEMVGIVSQADVAQHLEDDDVGRLVEIISAAPPQQ